MKVEKGAGSKPSPTTNTSCRRRPGPMKYPQLAKFEVQYEDLKGFLFNYSGGSKMDKYLTSTKEFAKYIRRKFDYGADIQRSLKKETKTGAPVPTRLTKTGDGGALSGDQKCIWGMLFYSNRGGNPPHFKPLLWKNVKGPLL